MISLKPLSTSTADDSDILDTIQAIITAVRSGMSASSNLDQLVELAFELLLYITKGIEADSLTFFRPKSVQPVPEEDEIFDEIFVPGAALKRRFIDDFRLLPSSRSRTAIHKNPISFPSNLMDEAEYPKTHNRKAYIRPFVYKTVEDGVWVIQNKENLDDRGTDIAQKLIKVKHKYPSKRITKLWLPTFELMRDLLAQVLARADPRKFHDFSVKLSKNTPFRTHFYYLRQKIGKVQTRSKPIQKH